MYGISTLDQELVKTVIPGVDVREYLPTILWLWTRCRVTTRHEQFVSRINSHDMKARSSQDRPREVSRIHMYRSPRSQLYPCWGYQCIRLVLATDIP